MTDPAVPLQTCPACNGFPVDDDGVICSTCDGAGAVPVPEVVPAPPAPPSRNHGGPGVCTLCHPKGRGLFA